MSAPEGIVGPLRILLDTNALIDLESAPDLVEELRSVAYRFELLITPVQVHEDRDGTIPRLNLPLQVVAPADGIPFDAPGAGDPTMAAVAAREQAVLVTSDRELTGTARAHGTTVWSFRDLVRAVTDLT